MWFINIWLRVQHKKETGNVFVPTNTKKSPELLSGSGVFFWLVGALPQSPVTQNIFCGYAPIAALKNMTEAAVSYSLCCI